MFALTARRYPQAFVVCAAGLLVAAIAAGDVDAQGVPGGALDLVAVGIEGGGRAVLLATVGLTRNGRRWRYRSLDTSDLAQPITDVVLSAGGTKLFIQSAGSPGAVLDLLARRGHRIPLEYVNPRDLSTADYEGRQAHRLPDQRFVSVRDGIATVVDDSGRIQPDYPVLNGIAGAVSADGVALYVLPDGAQMACGEVGSSRGECHQLHGQTAVPVIALAAGSAPHSVSASSPPFLLLSGAEERTSIVDPYSNAAHGKQMRRAEAALRACLTLHSISMSDGEIAVLTDTLIRESAQTVAAQGRPVTDWRFFYVSPDTELYAPVLEFARLEPVFPSAFDMLEDVAQGMPGRIPITPQSLYDKYLELDVDSRRERCTLHYWTRSTPGSWIIEYWLYYPFDVGGLGAHLHDPEHIFVEVDKLGGTFRRAIGAGHGYMAGNNMYTLDKPGAYGVTLPLYAIVELGKHATAPDIDRDGVFTPGVDENEYRERAMIWGVRDVIGTINNEVLAYDTTMSGARRMEDALAPEFMASRFPNERDFRGRASCRLEPIVADEPKPRWGLHVSDFVIIPPCHDGSKECAQLHITAHPDFLDVRTVLKEWAFPHAFLRATYGTGPGRSLNSVGVGYAIDLDQVPAVGRYLPLPGRLGSEIFYWHQNVNMIDHEACVDDCKHASGVGWGLKYEQFISNLFGIFSEVRLYTAPFDDARFTFGPLVEAPLGKRSNINIEGGVTFMVSGPPKFQLRVSAGLWKPKTNQVGLRAGGDDGK